MLDGTRRSRVQIGPAPNSEEMVFPVLAEDFALLVVDAERP